MIILLSCLFFAGFIVFLSSFLAKRESSEQELREYLAKIEVVTEIERLKSLPDYEVNWLRGEGYDVEKAILELEALLITGEVTR